MQATFTVRSGINFQSKDSKIIAQFEDSIK